MIISDGTSVCVGAIVSVKCRSLFCNGCDLNATGVKTLLTVSGLKGKKTEQPSRSGRAGLLLSQTSVCLSCT